MKKERIFYLDFIRALSVMAIVIWHFNTSLNENHINTQELLFPFHANGHLGEIGVSLFFIISGAALMYTYKNTLDLKHYFKSRFISIYPMFWIAYISAFLYFFYINKSINNSIPKSRIILTLLGVDGYLLPIIPNFYILGEWFLGAIILFYLCFPLLRKLIIKSPKLLLIVIIVYYIIMTNIYNSSIPIDWNIAIRIFDIALGMYFIQYMNKINIYEFFVALIVSIFMLCVPLNINHIYEITITGIALFIVLAYLGQTIKNEIIKAICMLISKYSYAIFLVHHVVVNQIQRRFIGMQITKIETYCLFIISIIVITMLSNLLYTLNRNIIKYLNYSK